MTLSKKLLFVGETDTGKVREHNEDTIALDPDIGLLVLADGMGGYNAGEVASGIAVKTIVNLVRETVEREDLAASDPLTRLSRRSIVLRDAIQRANKIIHQTARTQPQCEGMGTTVVAALFHDDHVTIAHVGDSRLYRLRAANKNYVTRALGVEPSVEVGLREEAVEKGDHYVLCSDGLSDMVEDADIHLTINTFGDNLGSVAKHLIQLANDNGGRDNISVLLAQVLDAFPARRGLMERVLGWFG